MASLLLLMVSEFNGRYNSKVVQLFKFLQLVTIIAVSPEEIEDPNIINILLTTQTPTELPMSAEETFLVPSTVSNPNHNLDCVMDVRDEPIIIFGDISSTTSLPVIDGNSHNLNGRLTKGFSLNAFISFEKHKFLNNFFKTRDSNPQFELYPNDKFTFATPPRDELPKPLLRKFLKFGVNLFGVGHLYGSNNLSLK